MFCERQSKLAPPILGLANAIQTIPSLAIFGFLISVPFLGGIGKTPAIVALTLYALLPIIRNTYNLRFANIKQMELGLMYQALKEKQVDFIAANSTDGLIPVLNLVILEDDKKYFPPYQAIPIFNQEILQKYPELTNTINQLGGKVSTTAIQKMNYQVDNQSQPVEKIVSEWLKSQQL